jgi:hypothetical protein
MQRNSVLEGRTSALEELNYLKELRGELGLQYQQKRGINLLKIRQKFMYELNLHCKDPIPKI